MTVKQIINNFQKKYFSGNSIAIEYLKNSGINSVAQKEIEDYFMGENIQNIINELENDNFGSFKPSESNYWVSGDPICAPEKFILQLVEENFEKSKIEQIYRHILVLNKDNDLYKIYNPNSIYPEIKRIEFLTDFSGKITKIQIMPD